MSVLPTIYCIRSITFVAISSTSTFAVLERPQHEMRHILRLVLVTQLSHTFLYCRF